MCSFQGLRVVALLALLIACGSTANGQVTGQPDLYKVTSEGIVYLASGSGALQRYDLAHGVWLEGYINDSGEPFDGFVVSDDEAVYGWQSDTVVNVSNGFRLLERFSSEVVSGVVVANGLVVTTSTELSVTGDGLGNRVVYDDEAALGFRLLHALTATPEGRVYGLQKNGGLSEVILSGPQEFERQRNGPRSFPAKRLYHHAASQRFIDSQGVAYDAESLSFVKGLSEGFRDLVFLSDGSAVVLHDHQLSLYDAEFSLTHFKILEEPVDAIEVVDNERLALIRISPSAPQGFAVENSKLSELEEATEGFLPNLSQDEAFNQSEYVFAGQGSFHLVSRPRGQLTRFTYGAAVSSERLPIDHGVAFVAKHPDNALIHAVRSDYAKIGETEVEFLPPSVAPPSPLNPNHRAPVIAGLTATEQSVMLGIASDGDASRGIDELRIVLLENDALFSALLAVRLDPTEVVYCTETQRTYFYTAESPARVIYRTMNGQNLRERNTSDSVVSSRDVPLTVTLDGGYLLVGSGRVLDAVSLEVIEGISFHETYEHLVGGPSSFLTTKTVAGQTQMDVWDAATLAHVGRLQFQGEAEEVVPASDGRYVLWPSGQLIEFDEDGLPRAASYPQGLRPVTDVSLDSTTDATTRTLTWQDPSHGRAHRHQVEARESPDDSWATIAFVDGSSASATFSTPSPTYQEFRVVSSIGETVATSGSVFVVPENTLVGRGYDFKLAHHSLTTATFTWRDPEMFETGWEIVMDGDTVITSSSSNVTEATITGLTPGNTYFLQLRARLSDLKGPGSPEIRFTVLEDLAVLPPSDFRVSWRSARRVDLQWIDHAINEPGYKLVRTRLDISDEEDVEVHLLPFNSQYFSDTSVISGASYRYTLSVLDEEEGRLIAEVTTPHVSQETTRPFAQSGNAVYVGQPGGRIARFDAELGRWLEPIELATGASVVTLRADDAGLDLLMDDNTLLRWNIDGTRQTVTQLDHQPSLLLGTVNDVLTIARNGLLSVSRNTGAFTWTSSVAPLTHSFAGNADKGIIVGRRVDPAVQLVLFDSIGQIIASSTVNADTGSQLFLSPNANSVVSNSGQNYQWDGTSLKSSRRDLGGPFERLVFQGAAPILLRGDVLAIYDNELLPVADHVFGESPSLLASSLEGLVYGFFEDWTEPHGFRVNALALSDLGLLPSGERVPSSIEVTGTLPSLLAGEDAFYESTISFVDLDGKDLVVTLVQGPDWLVLEDQGNGMATLSGTPKDASSSGTIIGVEASNEEGKTAFYSFALTVSPVDDGPEVRPIDPIVVNEDSEPTVLDLEKIFIDEEDTIRASNVSVFPLSEDASRLITVREAPSITGTTFQVDYLRDAYGETSFQLAFRDSNGAEAIATIQVHVLPVNDQPKGEDVSVTLKQGETRRLSLLNLFYDPDDPIRRDQISLLDGHEAGVIVSFDSGSSDTQIRALEDIEGNFGVTYRLSLPDGAFIDSHVTVTVEQPFLPLRPRYSFYVRKSGEPLVIDLGRFFVASGWDLDLLSYAIDLPDPSDQLVVVLPVPGQVGTISLQGIKAGSGTLDVVATGPDNFRQELRVVVVVDPELEVPERVVRYPFEVMEDSGPLRIELAGLFSEAVGQDFIGYSVRRDPFIDGLATLSTREISEPQLVLIHFTPNAHGRTTVSLLLDENSSAGVPTRLDLDVTVIPVPDAPTTSGFAPLTLLEDDSGLTVKLSDHFSDPEDTARGLSYSASFDDGLQGVVGVSIDAPSDLLTLFPEPDQFGNGIVTITATDRDGMMVSATQEIVIEPMNDPPTIQSLEPIVVSEDGPTPFLRLSDFVDDLEDGVEELSISVSSDASLGEILTPSVDPETQVLSLTLLPDGFGSGFLLILVKDSEGLTAESTVSVTVLPSPDPPTAIGFGEPLVLAEDAPAITYSLWDRFMDIDSPSSELVYGVSFQYPEQALLKAEIDEATGILSLTPFADAFGQGTLTVTATDTDARSISSSLAFTITDVPDAPRATGLNVAVLNEDDQPVTLRLVDLFTDVDSSIDSLSYAIQSSDASNTPFRLSRDSRDDSFTLSPKPDQSGNGTFVILATDNTNLTTELLFEVSVLPLPDAPQVNRLLSDVTVSREVSPTTVSLIGAFTDADPNTDLLLQVSSENPDLVLTIDYESETLTIGFEGIPEGSYEITLAAQDNTGRVASQQFSLNIPAFPLPDRQDHIAIIRKIDQWLEIVLPSLPGVSQVLQTSLDGVMWIDNPATSEEVGDKLWWRISMQGDAIQSLYRFRFGFER